ncbi:gamma-mobile-trio recombinase GmtY [Magnetospirillum sulfuroxidans]|uniref:Site-specific integrase n=1 Tax=Magnetospirillum sulfuroxidans TaxID=611300 RepID=A0ABS5IBM3_9PROT|nr:gamma-mobile-trio recombinase GmtY [Magnetospirillum sulfuroxidans]MBR9971815.1 site-specific integrase [Magnetospirillum sulfuroxidans]
MNLIESSRAHWRVEHLDAVGLPVVSILLPGGIPWTTWSDYRHRLGIGAQRSQARHIGSLIEFMDARWRDYLPLERRTLFMQHWVDALVMGTVGPDGDDPSDLFWLPKSAAEVRRSLQTVTAFGDWLAESRGIRPLNPERQASLSEQIVFWRGWAKRKDSSLFAHLRSAGRAYEQSRVAREITVRKQSAYHENPANETKRFPEESILPLLRDGFSSRPPHLRWTILRDQLITILLHFGGRRISEVLQMWIGDVQPHPSDPTRCVPWVHHPSDGYAEYRDPKTGATGQIRRDEYLRLVYGRAPLTAATGRRRVGFKNPLLTHRNALRTFWSDAAADRVFWSLYLLYIQSRPKVSRHPYLFVTPAGDPMTRAGFEKVHAAAVRRIGLIPAKRLGTTPHGHRHAYGSRAAKRGVSSKALQVAMGHRTPASQETYKGPLLGEIAEEMEAAEKHTRHQLELGCLLK